MRFYCSITVWFHNAGTNRLQNWHERLDNTRGQKCSVMEWAFSPASTPCWEHSMWNVCFRIISTEWVELIEKLFYKAQFHSLIKTTAGNCCKILLLLRKSILWMNKMFEKIKEKHFKENVAPNSYLISHDTWKEGLKSISPALSS